MDKLELLNNLIEAVKTHKMSSEEAFKILIKEQEKELLEEVRVLFKKKIPTD